MGLDLVPHAVTYMNAKKELVSCKTISHDPSHCLSIIILTVCLVFYALQYFEILYFFIQLPQMLSMFC